MGGTSISLTNKFILSEVVDLLARHPNLKVMVTGYADKSGNTQSNLLLSQKRSRSVRDFILKSGLNSERVIMNYFGDRDSQGVNAADRRVVIDFLVN
jgi:outer membrane protein OmpA-like peptidoglycan-associated protein